MARRAEDKRFGPPIMVVNPGDEVSAESFTRWLDQLQAGEPVHLDVTAAETLNQVRAAGEV